MNNRQPLKLKLTNQERGYYSNMWMMANSGDASKLGGQQAVMFFRRSNLSIDKLKEIWKISANTSNEFLTKDEFYIVLRLIAYA